MRATNWMDSALRSAALLCGVVLSSLAAPGETVLVGDRDGFVGPDDPNGVIFRRPEFDAFVLHPNRNNCAWHNCRALPFDTDNTLDWSFGHSFMNLPTLASATLEIHVRGGGFGRGNDGIALQYINTGDPNDPLQWAWGWFGPFNLLETVPGAISDGDGSWDGNDELTVVLDLSALPGPGGTTVDLLPMINADGYLDVYIADDTDVDYIELNYTPAYFGLPHVPLGQARLEPVLLEPNNPNSPRVLRVTNISNTGQDGVLVMAGENRGIDMEVIAPAFPDGAITEYRQFGRLISDPNNVQILSRLRMTVDGLEIRHEPDFSFVGASAYDVELWLDNTLIGRFTDLSGPVVHHPVAQVSPHRKHGWLKCLFKRYGCANPKCPKWVAHFSEGPEPVTIDGVGSFVADTMVFSAGSRCTQIVDGITMTAMTAAGYPSLLIVDEALLMFNEIPMRVLGGATFNPQPGRVILENVGTSGNDGVQIDGQSSICLRVTYEDLSLPDGASLQLSATDDLGMARGLSIVGQAGSYAIQPFFPTAEGYQLVGYLNGAVVFGPVDPPDPNGPTLAPGDPLNGVDTDIKHRINNRRRRRASIFYSGPTAFDHDNDPTTPPVTIDRLAFLDNATADDAVLVSASLTAANIPSVTITQVAMEFTCAGDLTGDSVVDLTDLSILLNHFGTTGGAAPADGDIDGNGNVDLTDLSILLNNFGSACN